MNKQKQKKQGTLARLLKMLFKFYPVLVPVTILCIIFSAITAAIPSIFTQNVVAAIENWIQTGDWETASKTIIPMVSLLIAFYVLSISAITLYTQLTVTITQGFLCKLRRQMFDGMQDLPIKFFDTNKTGDIMSYYTNDIDPIRPLISQSLPMLLQSVVIVAAVFSIMIWYSVWMTVVVILGVLAMVLISKKIGGGSAKYFLKQQKSIGRAEGYIQEMMNGQKVIKVFCHEEEAKKGTKCLYFIEI